MTGESRSIRQTLRKSAGIASGVSTDPLDRFIAWKEAALLGDARAIEQLKEPLSQINVEQIRKLESRDLQSTMEMLRKTDAAWVNDWVINKMLAGALDPDGWMQMVNGISVALRDELLDRATTQNLSEMRVPGVIPLLRAFPDREVVRRLFRRLCELVPLLPPASRETISRRRRSSQAKCRICCEGWCWRW